MRRGLFPQRYPGSDRQKREGVTVARNPLVFLGCELEPTPRLELGTC